MHISSTISGNSRFDFIKPEHVFIVAEIGKNFIQTVEDKPIEVYLENAKRLVESAKEAGANAVKFQTHEVEDEFLNVDVTSPHFIDRDRYSWITRNTNVTPLDAFWKPLKSYCNQIGITFFSTPMSRGAARKLSAVGVPFWKVASSDILDFPMLDFMAHTGKPIILSSGMSTIEELDCAVDFLTRRHVSLVLLHAISRYPYPPEDSNLLTIRFLQNRYPGVPIGFSQNSPWIEPPLVAVALDAIVVEQHFTLRRDLWGPDHKVSMTPDEFALMVQGIRELQTDPIKKQKYLAGSQSQNFLGSEEKILQTDEIVFRPLFRKALMAGQDIAAGTEITMEMIYAMRPQIHANGLPSECYEEVLEKRVARGLRKYDPITSDSV
jgi:sialic acid synthase SpsE